MKNLVLAAVVVAVLVPASMAWATNPEDAFLQYSSLPTVSSNAGALVTPPQTIDPNSHLPQFGGINYSSYADGQATFGFSGRNTTALQDSGGNKYYDYYPNSWGDMRVNGSVNIAVAPTDANLYHRDTHNGNRYTGNASTVITYRQHIDDMYSLDANGDRITPQRANATAADPNTGVLHWRDGVGDSPTLVYSGATQWYGGPDVNMYFGAVSATKCQMWLGGYWFDNNYRPGTGWDGTNPLAGQEFNFNLAQAVAAGGVNLDVEVTNSTVTYTVSDATGQKASVSCNNPKPLTSTEWGGGAEKAATTYMERAYTRAVNTDPNATVNGVAVPVGTVQMKNFVVADNMSVCMSAFGNVTDHAGQANFADIDYMANLINTTSLANRSGGLANLKYNINGDNVIDSADRDLVIQAAGGKNEADFTLDNKVDVKDLQAWLAGSASGGTLTGFANGDGNGDGKVDVKDLQLWLAASTSDIQPAGITATPEPATMTLLGLGVVAMLRRRK